MKFSLPSLLAAVCFALRAGLGACAAEPAPDELVNLRATFDKDVDFATRPIRDRYVSRLEKLKISLGSRGDARGAAAVQDEIDRIRVTSGQAGAFAKFAGTWKLTYSSGAIRQYTISLDGNVTKRTHGEGAEKQPLPPARLTVKGTEVLLDSDGVIERFKVADKILSLDYFAPKTLYPASAPSARATGSLISIQQE